MIGYLGRAQPVAPVSDGRFPRGSGLVPVSWHLAGAPGQRDIRGLASGQLGATVAPGLEHPKPDIAGNIEPKAAVLRGDRHRLVALVPVAPSTLRGPVIKEGRTVDHHLDLAAETRRSPQQHASRAEIGRCPVVVRAAVMDVSLTHHQQVMDNEPPGRSLPGRLQDHRSRDVGALIRHLLVRRAEPELAGSPVQQRPEHTRRVRAGKAQPLNRAVGRDQAALLAIREERVVLDRRKLSHNYASARTKAWAQAAPSIVSSPWRARYSE